MVSAEDGPKRARNGSYIYPSRSWRVSRDISPVKPFPTIRNNLLCSESQKLSTQMAFGLLKIFRTPFDIIRALTRRKTISPSCPEISPSCITTEKCIQDLLIKASEENPSRGLILYPDGKSIPAEISYKGLYTQAEQNSYLVRSLEGFKDGAPVLLHLDNHWDNILWFWATLLAGGLPVMSSPFSNAVEQRKRHIDNLSTLLDTPLCITKSRSLKLFEGCHGLKIHTIESLLREPLPQKSSKKLTTLHNRSTAVLMLTSGSTGVVKAVRLSHNQIISSVSGKALARQLPTGKPFLNWIGLDHVGGLLEIHLQAMYLGLDQVHVQSSDIISSPRLFLDLLSKHQISRSFAPNFFLAKLVATIESQKGCSKVETWNLRHLVSLVSGGELNDAETCIAVSNLLAKHGAPCNALMPGFGMTETCAGSIYNLNCPEYDVRNQYAFASLGKCIKGIEMRVTTCTQNESVQLAASGEAGNLEVRGEVVFKGYYRNEEATTEAFTSDGWFRTGDQAIIDSANNLRMIGRVKDTININGVKFSPADLDISLGQVLSSDVTCVASFPSRSAKSHTEQITVAYVPKEWPMQTEALVGINDKIVRTCVISTGSKPFVFALDDEALIPQSTLGKRSKAQLRTLFESGAFAKNIELHDSALDSHRLRNMGSPANEAEERLLRDFAEVLGLEHGTIGVNTPFFDMGITSMDLIRLKRVIDTRVNLDIQMTTLMTNPTARSLVVALEDLNAKGQETYNPVVTLRHEGSKTPLWLVHPGVGEMLVFLALSNHIDDRPVYALRARGFNGEAYFSDLDEVITTYHAAIKQRQPQGPYAISGYSYGTMLAFEVSKLLEQDGATIQFLGGLNLPPHIKTRMRQLDWNMCLLHLAYFLDLISEEHAESMEDDLKTVPRAEAMAKVLDAGDIRRLSELGLDESSLANWASLSYRLQSMAVDYEPSGSVAVMDVFHAMPLKVAAKSRQDWVENHLGKWEGFCRTTPRLHKVGGSHYTMLGPDHVAGFAASFKRALKDRGL